MVGRECSTCRSGLDLTLVGEYFLSMLDGEFWLFSEMFMAVSGEINPVAVLASSGRDCLVVCGGCFELELLSVSVAFFARPPSASPLPLLPLGGGQVISFFGAVDVSACGS